MARSKNLYVDQGSTFVFSLTATNASGATMGITSGSGYTASCQFRRSYYSTTSVSLASSITGTGVIQCALSATASAALKDGRYVYDVELAFPDGTIVRQQQGNVTVDPEVSK